MVLKAVQKDSARDRRKEKPEAISSASSRLKIGAYTTGYFSAIYQ